MAEMKEKLAYFVEIPNEIVAYSIVIGQRGIERAFFGTPKPSELSQYPFGRLQRASWRDFGEAKELMEYFNGKRLSLSIPYSVQTGTAFQQRVWNAIAEIAYGETKSYGDIGRSMQTHAFRAVGQACKRNPIPIIIPCHRVIASDGSIGGFFGNLPLKRKLLLHEQSVVNTMDFIDYEAEV